MPEDMENNPGEMDDLEAQLAALGIFGESEDMGIDASLLSGDDDDEAAFAALEALSQPSGGDSGGGGGSDSEMDLDKQLEMLLQHDMAASEGFEVKDVNVTAPTQSVYDPEVDGMGMVQYVKGSFNVEEEVVKPKLFENITWSRIIATAVIGLVFIAAGAFTVVFITYNLRDQREAVAAVSHFTPISMPVNVANNANAIFINQIGTLNGRTFTLSRVSIGYLGTYFYFDEDFSTDDYVFLLYNQARNLYAITTFNIQTSPGTGTVVKFDSISHNTLFLTLHVQCKQTNDYISFNYRFLSPPSFVEPVYIPWPISINADNDPFLSALEIRHAVFDNTSSKIHYSFRLDTGQPGLGVSREIDVPFVSMQDAFTSMFNMSTDKTYVYFDDLDMYMGVATFGPVLNLHNRVDVIFHGLTYYYPRPIVDITPLELFERDQRGVPHSIPAGPFILNLEAMAQQGHYVVLTLHGLDEDGRRRRTIPNMSLNVSIPGRIISLHGYARHSVRGTDMLFDLRPYNQELRGVPISQYSLIIHSVEFEVPQVTVPVILDQITNMPSARRASAEISITEAFMSLLSYKSNEIDRFGIVGVSQAKLNDDGFMSGFTPQLGLTERPLFGATVVTGDLVSNYDYLAIVEVQWAHGFGANMSYYHAVYRVSARSQDLIWSIVEVVRI